jgi:hypothetical protein
VQLKACEIRLRAERRAGELLKDLQKAVGGRPSKTTPHAGESFSKSAQIERAGLTRKQAEKFEALAKVPKEIFDAELKHSPRPTTSGIIKARTARTSGDTPRQITPPGRRLCDPDDE